MEATGFHEGAHRLKPIRELGLRIEGTRLEPLIQTVRAELIDAGLTRVRPGFYLSTEWGVAMGSVAVAIPFYLADAHLAAYHKERVGHLEGVSDAAILRYLRHEIGHVVNYAYALYERRDWVATFGEISLPYTEDYRPKPFSRNYVRHLPGWYAQKHPDEDWAETFAVWMTPGQRWLHEYDTWPGAFRKLQYVERLIAQIGPQDPPLGQETLDEPVHEIGYSLDEHYQALTETHDVFSEIDGLLRSLFPPSPQTEGLRNAGTLIRALESHLIEHVFEWTGHFPERTQVVVRRLASHADSLSLRYSHEDEAGVIVSLTTFVAALAMNYVSNGAYCE